MRPALVLGGGGPVGIAWELGVLAGLADAGLDLSAADRIVGTSAGSVVGVQIAAGRSPAALYHDHLDAAYRARLAADALQVPAANLGGLMTLFMRRPPGEVSPPALLRDMGAYALETEAIGEDAFVDGIRRLVVTGADWPSGFACTAVDVETGDFRLWDEAAGVELARAVASSCAVPGLYPPVTIGGRRYMDGGMRSATNADAVAGAEAVLVVAVTVRPIEGYMAADAMREFQAFEGEGQPSALIVPDAAALDAFGPNLMAWSRHEAVTAAGRSQGRREAARLGFWPKT